MHRRKGTLYAIERYLSYLDVPLAGFILPPDKPFAGATFTDEERAAYLARFPQIRTYEFRSTGVATYGAFGKGAFKLPRTFLGSHGYRPPQPIMFDEEPMSWNGQPMVWSEPYLKPTVFPFKTDAWERLGRRAFLWDKGPHFLASGLETPVKWLERTQKINAEDYYVSEQVLIPGVGVKSILLGAGPLGNHDKKDGRHFLMPSAADKRVVTLSVKRTTVTAEDVLKKHMTVPPSLDVINAFPQRGVVRGTSKMGVQVFAGMPGRWLDVAAKERRPIKGYCLGFLPETTAGDRLFEQIFLHDPERLPDGRARSVYLGHFRLCMPAYPAVLAPDIKGTRSVDEATIGRFCTGFLSASSQQPLHNAREAVKRSMAVRDKILLRTQLHRTVTSRDLVRSGSGVRAGGVVAVPLS